MTKDRGCEDRIFLKNNNNNTIDEKGLTKDRGCADRKNRSQRLSLFTTQSHWTVTLQSLETEIVFFRSQRLITFCCFCGLLLSAEIVFEKQKFSFQEKSAA